MERILLYCLVAVGFLNGCNYSIQKNPAGISDIPPSSNYLKTELTYNSVYSRVFRKNCVSCHGAGSKLNLEDYGQINGNLSKIFQATIIERKMPKSPMLPLNKVQLGLLSAWISVGAPLNAGVEEEPLPSLEPKFESIKSHIIEIKCTICHSPGQSVARIPLLTKEDFINSPLDIVVPGDADESGLVLSITNLDPNKLMPPPVDVFGKKTGFLPLSDQEIKTIKDWINSGAKD